MVAIGLFLAVAAVAQQPASQPDAHWSLVRPERPLVPDVGRAGWAQTPIDHFVLARLEREGLAPADEADRTVLIRRLSLDLTGLPPTIEEVDAFVADDSPDAYGKLVDRLLASPHYGERMALHWLDLARYADTNGYLDDDGRQMWKWRDWVIDAFNENVPFDQFTIEQIAGDMLPNATLAQRVATGFHRNHPISGEGTGQPGEYAHHYVADRVKTTGSVWLGLTLGCAECHDHKYDPIPQRDYYRFYAFFDNVPEKGVLGGNNAMPFLRLPSESQGARLTELQQRIDDLERQRRVLTAGAELAAERWLDELRSTAVPAAPEALAHFTLDETTPAAVLRGIGHARWVDGVAGKALQLDGKDSFVEGGSVGAFTVTDAFTVGAWIRTEGAPPDDGGVVAAKTDDSRLGRGWALGIDDDQVYIELVASRFPRDNIYVTSRDRLDKHRWHHVVASYDGTGKVSGLRLYIDGEAVPVEDLDDDDKEALRGDIDHLDPFRIGCTDGSPFNGAIDDVRLYDRALSSEEVRAAVRADLSRLARRADRTPAQRLLLRDHYQTRVSDELRPVLTELAELGVERTTALGGVPQVSVMAERRKRRPTQMRIRGDYSQLGEVVEPGVPAVLPPLPADASPDRLGLAQWLVHTDNPLVGRVAVNRFWSVFFGEGLVSTLDDFGTQGELPSHPSLLDWLARDFVDGGWDTKALVRSLVMSATYRQSSRVDRALLARDPGNRLLGRAARMPLAAELVRDNALAVAGLLDRKQGGPSVRPWQPEGLWLAVAGFEGERYEPSPVADRYRRGLYVYRKRGAPYGSFTVFDAPTHEVCTVRRSRTNTPLQALVLLNDRVYLEAARGLAQRLLRRPGDDRELLTRGFRLAIARHPEPAELDRLAELLERQRDHFETHRDEAGEVAAIGDILGPKGTVATELAPWVVICSVLLNLDEAITRG